MKVFRPHRLWYTRVSMIDDDHSQLRKMERELYTTDIQPPTKRSVLHPEKIVAEDEWKSRMNTATEPVGTMNTKIKTTSIFRNIFLGSLGFLLVALIIFGATFLGGGNTISEKNVDIVVTTKSFVDGGEIVPVEVTLINKNKLPLELATLVLNYPEGNDEGAGKIVRATREIGTVGVGATHQETFTIQLYGTENSQRTITAHIEFRVQGSNAVYDKDEPVTVTIRTSPVTVTLEAPEKAIPNQEIPLVFSIGGNGTSVLANTAMILQYPEGFTFTKSEPAPSFGNTVWYLGDLPPGVNRKITVYGTLTGSVTDLKTIRASVGAQNQNNDEKLDTVYNTLAQVIPLSEAFLDAKITVANQTGTTVALAANEQARIRIPWKNTLSVPITNAELSVSLSGTAYDPARVEPVSGYFESANNKIIWTKQQIPALATINPGAMGEVSFSIRPRVLSGGQVINPAINVSLSVVGYQSGGTKLMGTNIDSKTFAISSDLNLLVRTIHYTGTIQNSGPMPPKPNKETTYALEWKTSNMRNRVDGAIVTTTLPTYVSWKNIVVPQSEAANVSYNEVTRQLVWNVGDLPAGTNVSQRIISMKIGITPSLQQLGSTPNLTDSIVLTGTDAFTKQNLTITKLPLNTQLLNDGNGPGTYGQVEQ